MAAIQLEHKRDLLAMKVRRTEERDAVKAARARDRREFDRKETEYHARVTERLVASQDALKALQRERALMDVPQQEWVMEDVE